MEFIERWIYRIYGPQCSLVNAIDFVIQCPRTKHPLLQTQCSFEFYILICSFLLLCFNWDCHVLYLVSLLLLCLLRVSDLYTTHQSSLFWLTFVDKQILNKKKCSLKVEQKWKAKSRAKMLRKSQNIKRLFMSALFSSRKVIHVLLISWKVRMFVVL